jgi:sugar lactone lactonase YvrE
MTAIPDIRPVTTVRDELGEGPVWNRGRLLRVDILSGKVHSLDPASGETTTLTVAGEVSAVVPRADSGMLLAIDHEIIALDRHGARDTLAIVEDDRPHNRFNDCRCDARGRLWAGTMSKRREPGTAALYCLEANQPIRCVVPGTTLSNGIGWSPADDQMFFIDSTTQRLDVFDFDPDAGMLANRRVVATIDPSDGMPDGLAVDAEGGIWVCLFGGSAIRRYTPAGQLDETIQLPVTHPTCPSFGGPDLATLYITSTRHRLSPDELARQPLAGAVLALAPGVHGIAANRFAS